ncbi:hypothetical protein R6Q59_002790 [Mikania micrantha]
MGVLRRLGYCKSASRTRPSSIGSKIICWFKFGKNGVDAEGAGIYGSQSRDDFDRVDVEQAGQTAFLRVSSCMRQLKSRLYRMA